jgi:hypothetical protein
MGVRAHARKNRGLRGGRNLHKPDSRRRNVVERCFCRLKDWRRIDTRYDKLARNNSPYCV